MPSNPTIHHMRRTYQWQQIRKVILHRDRGICWICNQPGATTVDHIIPLSKGGPLLDPNNLRAAHRSCNSRRGAANKPTNPKPNSRKW